MIGPRPSHRFHGMVLAAIALGLGAACGDADRPAPRDEASLAPYVATPQMVVDEMLRLVSVGKDDVVYDLGSGDGRIVIAAARTYGARGVGFELDAGLVSQSTENARGAGVAHLVEFRHQDVVTVDLSPATGDDLPQPRGQPEAPACASDPATSRCPRRHPRLRHGRLEAGGYSATGG